jgi:hypothetical protein
MPRGKCKTPPVALNDLCSSSRPPQQLTRHLLEFPSPTMGSDWSGRLHVQITVSDCVIWTYLAMTWNSFGRRPLRTTSVSGCVPTHLELELRPFSSMNAPKKSWFAETIRFCVWANELSYTTYALAAKMPLQPVVAATLHKCKRVNNA